MEYESFLSLMNPFEQTEVFSSDMPENPKIEEKEQNIGELLETYAVRFLPAGLLNTNEYETAIRQNLERIFFRLIQKHTSFNFDNLSVLANELRLSTGAPKLVYSPYLVLPDLKIRDLQSGAIYDAQYTNPRHAQILNDITNFKNDYDKKPVPGSVVSMPSVLPEKNTEVWFYPVVKIEATLEGKVNKELSRHVLARAEPLSYLRILEKYLIESKIQAAYEFYPNKTSIFNASLNKKNSSLSLTAYGGKIIEDHIGNLPDYIMRLLFGENLVLPAGIFGFIGGNVVLAAMGAAYGSDWSFDTTILACGLIPIGGVIACNLAMAIPAGIYHAIRSKYDKGNLVKKLSSEWANKQKTSIPVDFNKWPDAEKRVFIH